MWLTLTILSCEPCSATTYILRRIHFNITAAVPAIKARVILAGTEQNYARKTDL